MQDQSLRPARPDADRAGSVATSIPSWADDGRGRLMLGSAAIGLASLMIAADAAEAQQFRSANALPPVHVDAPQARRAARPSTRQTARPQRTAAPAPRPAATGPQNGIVSGLSPANTNTAGTGLSTRPGNIQNTPQTVNVITEQVMREQGVATLEQALRNVPGVTVSVGEGGGAVNGDSFRIRGFTASNDIYTDGLRDFGAYVRDSFSVESVQVFKGPSSDAFGNGTVGGGINTTTRTAKAGNFFSADILAGSGLWGRAMVDLNRQINENQAVRIFGVANKQAIVSRDNVYSDRYGAGLSFVTGLQSDTLWALTYVHQHNERTPDYGVPLASNGPGFNPTKANPALPVTEFGIPRSTYYGRDTDWDTTNSHLLTSKFQHELNSNVTLYNNTRLGLYDREFTTSVPQCSSNNTPICGALFSGGNPNILFAGRNPRYDQNTWWIQNTASAVARFDTGMLRHEAVAGIDAFYVANDRQNYALVGNKAPQPIRTPIFNSNGSYSFVPDPWYMRRSRADSVAVFASDRVWLTDKVSILGGVRWERYGIDYTQRDTMPTVAAPNPPGNFSRTETASYLTPKAAVILEPWKNQTFYVSYAEAAVPPGQLVTTVGSPVGQATPGLQIERTTTYEGGFKLNTPDNRIGFTGAVFQVTKNNALYRDPVTGDLTSTGERIRVEGFEAGITGAITPAWTLALGYAYLTSKVLESPTNAGNQALDVARNNVSLWSTYNLSTLFDTGSGRLTAGFGATYRDKVFADNANIYMLPDSFRMDGMLAYEWAKYRVAMNIYNIADRLNYDASTGSRALPSAGRTVTLSASVRW